MRPITGWSRTNARYCVNDTGTGNTLDLSHPRVLQMVADSLRYWAESYHVDGFRFDLGVTLGRDGNNGFDPRSGFFDVLRQDPVLNQLKLISEPWDIGPGGYQLGNHPPGFAEWNDKFRDATRSFWRGDSGHAARIRAAALPALPTCSTGARGGPGPASISSPRMTASR